MIRHNLVYIEFNNKDFNCLDGISLPTQNKKYQTMMKAIPHTRLNLYGIVIVDLNISTKY